MPSCDQVPGGPSTPIKSNLEEKASPFNKAKSSAKSPTKNTESATQKKTEPSQSKAKVALWANTILPKVKPVDYKYLLEHHKWLFHHVMSRKECDTLATFWVTNKAILKPIDQCMMSSNVHELSVVDWILRCMPNAPMTPEVNDAIMKLKGSIQESRNGRNLFQYEAQTALMINRFHLREAVVFYSKDLPIPQTFTMRMTPAFLTEANKMKPKLTKNERMAFQARFMRLHYHRDLIELIKHDTVIKDRFLSSIQDPEEVLACSSSSDSEALQPVTLGMPLSEDIKKALATGWFWPMCQSYAKENRISQDDMTILAYDCFICFGMQDSIDKSLDECYERAVSTWSKCKCSYIHYCSNNETLF
jgi:hypothetical protein